MVQLNQNLGSRFTVQGVLEMKSKDLGSWFMVQLNQNLGSWFMVQGVWEMKLKDWFMVHGSVEPKSWFTVHGSRGLGDKIQGSWFPVHGSIEPKF